MPYKQTNWEAGQLISSDELNNIENELSRVSGIIDNIVKVGSNGIKFGDQETITLTTNNWNLVSDGFTQTITVQGITSINSIIIAPAPNSYIEYASNKIRCISQSTNSLTFKAVTKPEEALDINLLILPYVNIEVEENAV